MSSLYKKDGTYYLAVQFHRKRIVRSLRTREYYVAKAIRPEFEKQILNELINGKSSQEIPLKELVERYLVYDHGWRTSTKILNTRLLHDYLKKGFPENQTTRAMAIIVLNGCNRWGYRNKLISSYDPIPEGNNYKARTRVFTKDELKIMFEKITPHHFNLFVQSAYYTGARSGEIPRISKENVFSDSMVVFGKSGKRIVKLNSQAKDILVNNPLWDYSVNYVQLTWSRNRKRLNLHDARFHDSRRTFGYNLIKQGRPIYEVSKLLGHSSVITTERHYAPLLATEIDDFVL